LWLFLFVGFVRFVVKFMNVMNRREFIKVAVRGLATAGLAGLAGVALWRAKGNRELGGECTGNGVCRGCPRVTACQHPTALSFKRKATDF